ncbi:hypothetical protein VPHK406_0125 [Vibrio phage K406]
MKVDLHNTRFTFKDKRDETILYTFDPNLDLGQPNTGFILWIAKDGKPSALIEPLPYVMSQLGKNWFIVEVL